LTTRSPERFYRAALALSRSARIFVADPICKHQRSLGSRWRRLPPGHEALLFLVHLRHNETFASLAAAFGVGLATAHRNVTEAGSSPLDRGHLQTWIMSGPEEEVLVGDLQVSGGVSG
jgi:hypothetical protein